MVAAALASALRRFGSLRLQKYIVALLFVSFFCGMILGIVLVTDAEIPSTLFGAFPWQRIFQ